MARPAAAMIASDSADDPGPAAQLATALRAAPRRGARQVCWHDHRTSRTMLESLGIGRQGRCPTSTTNILVRQAAERCSCRGRSGPHGAPTATWPPARPPIWRRSAARSCRCHREWPRTDQIAGVSSLIVRSASSTPFRQAAIRRPFASSHVSFRGTSRATSWLALSRTMAVAPSLGGAPPWLRQRKSLSLFFPLRQQD